MIPYWILFLVPAWLAVNALPVRDSGVRRKRWPTGWRWVFWSLVLMVGLREQVGGDWGNYLPALERMAYFSFSEAWGMSDPGYAAFNWLGYHWGGGIYLVNTLGAVVFVWGLMTLCRAQPRPWLALVVSVPYLIMVVGMGYTRQGIAAGFEMLGLVALGEGRLFAFLVAVACGALFHKSAVVLIPLAALMRSRYWLITWPLVAVFGWVTYRLLLEDSVDRLMRGYVEAGYASSGAAIRLAMNALPAALFLVYRRRFPMAEEPRVFWTWMSVWAWVFVVLLIVSPSSTAVDRVALYWIPLQLVIWSRAPDALSSGLGGSKRFWVWWVVLYSAVVHFTWLNFAVHSRHWLPYRFYPWELFWQ